MCITNARIVLTDRILTDHNVLVCAGKIKDILPKERCCAETIVDGMGHYLCPGFIDLHIHGTRQYLVDNGPNDLDHLCTILPSYGVTGFLPTVCPLPKGKDADFIRTLAKVKSRGTKILGFHLEGPFLTLTGALPPEALGNADAERLKSLIKAALPNKAIFSIAPDFKEITELIPLMAQNNTPVFITHTKATGEQTQLAIKAGASHATHFYNVFYPPDETEPGVRPCGAIEAILADENVSVDFILDGEHVSPAAVQMALHCKGADKVCLITDANVGAGGQPGKYQFGKEQVEFRYAGSPARFVKDGRLAGSGLTMNRAIKNACKLLGTDLPLAAKMASQNPARVLRLDDIGSIEIGKQADLVLLNEEFDVIQTWIDGNCCFKAST
ncbi:MAG: N-acetylglucosamine-6-phosphate deacetylase [Planctomycetaceae bacterium]|nr:N-acetylglucosamine-6-phosphate deacetylase [Planctomycetaceae bacterium]